MCKMSNSRLVYSTESGRIVDVEKKLSPTKGDGIIRIRRESSGRKGKGVCVITGLDLNKDELILLAAELKKKCGSGGSIKAGNIEIQGDKRELIKQLLEAKGMKVKLAGG
ncbi:stress response translation initiation inhibitor YciH [Arsenophonus apicola]|uniref:Stress response translation initiation inhibitor YciH n=1 Tax=Arsenophonus apicola TaxID=2879119 RepID=A0ABY8P085_9GAMM|nr:stress response translation initiation inhibitor YciH [Arsenophonus apicola]WGO82406.1 stress response translation initiation inhibitor YciH [Arsenophonus apicola]